MVFVSIASSSLTSRVCAAGEAKVVLLGSGTPIPDPDSSGPAVAVLVNGQAYLFDAGAGVVRRAQAASRTLGIAALDATRLDRVFFTHLHSDHTLGLPDLILTPWVVGRSEALEVYGPNGISAMTEHIKEAYAQDIAIRTQGLEHQNLSGLKVNVHEFETEGQIYKDSNITVTAIAVRHGSWPLAFGYAINAEGRKIVISGDTAPTSAIVDACQGCDVLLHEVYSAERLPPAGSNYHTAFHTSTKELGEIATKARPKLLVLYHQLYFGAPNEVDLKKEIRQVYSGAVVNGRDLGVY
jgi:ribonuclease Z